MKVFKKIAKIIICIPIVLVILVIAFEIIGMIVNHAATGSQTRALKNAIEEELTAAEVIDTYSETGNTSGTGNHVDMLSVVVFKTEDDPAEIEEKLKESYEFNEQTCFIQTMDAVEEAAKEGYYSYIDEMDVPERTDNCYMMYLNRSAPFADNIEGH